MRNNPEYNLCKSLSIYLRLQYKNVIFHFDYAGLAHTKTQAGMMKEIQGHRGYPDLFIIEPRGIYHGLFIELKADGVSLFKKNSSEFATPHIAEQSAMIDELNKRGYAASFCIGFNQAKAVIDTYLNYIPNEEIYEK